MAEGYERARLEAPRIIDYLKEELPGFANARFGGVAERLYIRETRHIRTHCTLSVDDVLNNVVTDRDVVAGGYPLDVQTLTPFDDGYVYGTPEVYGAQLCVAVPKEVDNLWVVGKAAGYDPLAASSARVVPFGMALGEAVGVAAAQAAAQGLTSTALIENEGAVQAVRSRPGGARRVLGGGAWAQRIRPRLARVLRGVPYPETTRTGPWRLQQRARLERGNVGARLPLPALELWGSAFWVTLNLVRCCSPPSALPPAR